MKRRLPLCVERPAQPGGLRPRGVMLALVLALASGCGMYGDLTLEERPVRTPEITELEPIAVPPWDAPDGPAPPASPPPEAAPPADEDEDERRNEDDPAGGS